MRALPQICQAAKRCRIVSCQGVIQPNRIALQLTLPAPRQVHLKHIAFVNIAFYLCDAVEVLLRCFFDQGITTNLHSTIRRCIGDVVFHDVEQVGVCGLAIKIGRIVFVIDHDGCGYACGDTDGKVGALCAGCDTGFDFMQQLITQIHKPAAVKR